MSSKEEQAMGSALAGGAIATAILEFLLDSETITRDDARAILDKARLSFSPTIVNSSGGHEAIEIIKAMLQGRKFSARG
jgi:hypothetical protein